MKNIVYYVEGGDIMDGSNNKSYYKNMENMFLELYIKFISVTDPNEKIILSKQVANIAKLLENYRDEE
jgi:hypothetical protein